jgi:glycosyltransferase involved in cell wall biosynthesis
MRIGIDISPLPSNPVGAGTYMIQLVRAISTLPSEHQFVIISQPKGRELVGEVSNPNVAWALTAERSPALRLLWEQTGLPIMARRLKLDLLHSLHYTRPFFLPCKSVVTFHDMTFFLFPELHTHSKRLFFPWAIRMSARRADAVISVSESTRRDALQILNISPEKIFAIPSGIGPEFRPIVDQELLLECRSKYNLPADFILFVGLIEPRKNLPMLLQSYAQLLKTQLDLPLVLVGRQGWDFEKVSQMIKGLGIERCVLLTGYIPDQDLPLIYNLARVFVYPSSYEGFGFPPLEAMACGTPVITSAVSAMLETVADGGVLIPPQDEDALTKALIMVLQDQSKQEYLSNRGQLRAAEFTWERTARETVHVYEHAVG